MKLQIYPDEEPVNPKLDFLKVLNVSCYTWLITLNFKVRQDAHFWTNFYLETIG